MRTELLDYALAKRRELERRHPLRAVLPIALQHGWSPAPGAFNEVRQPSDLKVSVIPWWRDQWEEGV